ncbi:hypothetical protein PGB28_03125 [Primorskyibacter aestuariivivens]|uniref:hypothetical protein n=1 Tax=Primorskyibacter aestuariivivens TaxID=1888912 RepID=UPI002300D4F2|nr:hypothetical protein [Primorskyibacter aestuariivivens]MDA7427438.1 hypothetical protein [Primorskyibacter aestuariivivens]
MSAFSQSAFYHLQTHRPFQTDKRWTLRSGFYPEKDPRKLHNCKQYFWIQPDGSTVAAAYLNALEDCFREEIILQDYVSHLCQTLRISLGMNYLARDNPWDFRIGFSTGVDCNVEITSITDRADFWKKITAEELIQRHSYYPTVRLGILKKISDFFPDQELSELIATHRRNGLSNSHEVENPYYPEKPKLFTSLSPSPTSDVGEAIRNAITSKLRKRHKGKDETILIIDNRTTTTELTQVISAIERETEFLMWSEFPEIWLYTGYGGGRNRKFSESLLLPMKAPQDFMDRYLEGLKKLYRNKRRTAGKYRRR